MENSIDDAVDSPTSTRQADRGATLIELLISIALMGIAVVPLLSAVYVTIGTSKIDRDQANSYAWLQAASDEVYNGPRTSCMAGRESVIAAYDQLVQQAERPTGWDTSNSSIAVTNVQFLGRSSPDGLFEWSNNFCFESGCPGTYCRSPLYTQKVTIVAQGANGGLTTTLESIKSE